VVEPDGRRIAGFVVRKLIHHNDELSRPNPPERVPNAIN
jgi:hypothetical protein